MNSTQLRLEWCHPSRLQGHLFAQERQRYSRQTSRISYIVNTPAELSRIGLVNCRRMVARGCSIPGPEGAASICATIGPTYSPVTSYLPATQRGTRMLHRNGAQDLCLRLWLTIIAVGAP